MSYWGYRVDSRNRNYFFDEIKHNKLRQGWGYDKSQDLSKENDVDNSARRNLPIYYKVKKGDYLLIPHIESWDEIVIVRATMDFKDGYKFNIPKEYGDYGHIFPVEYVSKFSRQNINVGANIRETFKCKSRFWNIDRCKDEIDKLVNMDEKDLVSKASFEERFIRMVESSFDEKKFGEDIYNELNKITQASEWEFILCEGLKKMLPKEYSINTTANRNENQHGADIIIRIPGIWDVSYVIAIQIKDYKDVVNADVVNQINKADNYFCEDSGDKLIDKYLIITNANKELNKKLDEKALPDKVKVLYAEDLKILLAKMGKGFLGETSNE